MTGKMPGHCCIGHVCEVKSVIWNLSISVTSFTYICNATNIAF